MAIDQLASDDFERAINKAFWRKVISWLTGERNTLLPFDEVRQRIPLKGQHSLGLRQVPLRQIVGSVGRYQDFDRAFLPVHDRTKDRWINIDAAYLREEYLPPVELIKMGEVYFVKDGNHRVSVARQRGQEFIDAYVTEIEIPVPLTPETDLEDLARKQAYAAFLEKTGLDRLRPSANLEANTPGQYAVLLDHIAFHQWALGQKLGREVAFEEAVTSWYDRVYWPLVEAVRQRDLLKSFPGMTETDLYVWLVKYQWHLSLAYRDDETPDDISSDEAKDEAARQLAEEAPQPLARKLANLVKHSDWMEQLILRQEREQFMAQTRLAETRPQARIETSLPGQYDRLLDHIAAHRWYMGEQRGAEVPLDEAAASWYDHAYLPLVEIIREQGILDNFPDRTEADLYLWLIEYREALCEFYRSEISLEDAAEQFLEEHSPANHQRPARKKRHRGQLLDERPEE